MAGISPRTGQGIGVLVLLGVMLIGFLILRPLHDAPRERMRQFDDETTVDQPLIDTATTETLKT